MNRFCQTNPRLALVFGIAIALASAQSHAEVFQGMDVTVEGRGPAMIFIPGLNSGKETFTDTCAQFKANYTCHLLNLPGFAGVPARSDLKNAFVEPMRDTILAYIKAKKLDAPVIVGHSLGGVTALLIAEKAPTVPKALVIVDSLPFFSAIRNPAATEESVKPMAASMKKQMLEQPLEQYQTVATQMVSQGMSNQTERVPLLQQWAKSSDRATTSQAMFDLMTIDLRGRVAKIKTPTLVLGAWAAYKAYGSTAESTLQIFKSQYQQLPGVQIKLSDSAYHFISWDDPKWLYQQSNTFLNQLQTK